jgi:hypothetical protein
MACASQAKYSSASLTMDVMLRVVELSAQIRNGHPVRLISVRVFDEQVESYFLLAAALRSRSYRFRKS